MRRLFMVIAVLLVISSPAFSLSDAEYLRMMKDPEFAEADRELNRLYKKALKTMSKAGAEHLKRGQRKWIEIWRDDYAQFLINDGTERIFAYTQAISSRISVIHGAMANDAEGYYDNLYGSYYQNAGDIGLFLDITWKNRSKKLLDVHFSHTGRFHYDDDDGWRGTGVLKGDTLVAENGGTKATITFGEKDIVRVKTNGTFKRDVDFDVEGSYSYK